MLLLRSKYSYETNTTGTLFFLFPGLRPKFQKDQGPSYKCFSRLSEHTEWTAG